MTLIRKKLLNRTKGTNNKNTNDKAKNYIMVYEI